MSNTNSGDNWSNSSSSGDSWETPQASGDDWSGADGDSFSETTHKSWFERIMESLKAILFGLAFVVGGCVLLFWNEGNSAKTIASLNEGAGLVASVSTQKVEPGNEGKLVHIAGETKAANPARDTDLGITANGLKLSRKVEMYQWKEERKSEKRQKLGGGEGNGHHLHLSSHLVGRRHQFRQFPRVRKSSQPGDAASALAQLCGRRRYARQLPA